MEILSHHVHPSPGRKSAGLVGQPQVLLHQQVIHSKARWTHTQLGLYQSVSQGYLVGNPGGQAMVAVQRCAASPPRSWDARRDGACSADTRSWLLPARFAASGPPAWFAPCLTLDRQTSCLPCRSQDSLPRSIVPVPPRSGRTRRHRSRWYTGWSPGRRSGRRWWCRASRTPPSPPL